MAIPGVSLDQVVNQMLVVGAKSVGADQVTALTFEIDPEHGVWSLWRLLGWRTAVARGIAVQVVASPAEAASPQGNAARLASPARP